jgi:hypothetical protein
VTAPAERICLYTSQKRKLQPIHRRRQVKEMRKIEQMMRHRRAHYVIAVGATILGALLITGCGSGTSDANRAGQLIQQYPWLAQLGLSFIQVLLMQYGSNLVALLIAAAAALVG